MSEPPSSPDPSARPRPTPEQKLFRPILIGAAIVVWAIVFLVKALPIRQGNEKSKPVARADSVGEERPAYGESVHVDEFPEPLKKWTPAYPERARQQGLEGTVVVQALVGRNGRVLETKIVQSDPNFDQAAETAVRRYTFKPAMSGGKPVAVWVAVPIRFVLN